MLHRSFWFSPNAVHSGAENCTFHGACVRDREPVHNAGSMRQEKSTDAPAWCQHPADCRPVTRTAGTVARMWKRHLARHRSPPLPDKRSACIAEIVPNMRHLIALAEADIEVDFLASDQFHFLEVFGTGIAFVPRPVCPPRYPSSLSTSLAGGFQHQPLPASNNPRPHRSPRHINNLRHPPTNQPQPHMLPSPPDAKSHPTPRRPQLAFPAAFIENKAHNWLRTSKKPPHSRACHNEFSNSQRHGNP